MKVLLISGHGAGDSGALGNGIKECDKTRELVNLIAPKLRKYATVDVYDQSRNAYQDCCNGTFKIGKYDYVFEVHFNAFNLSAYGTECFVVPEEKGITVEQAIMKNMGKYFTLRDNDNIFDGVKRTRFLVINTVKQMGMSGALLETCFIDNVNDMKIYEANKDAIAQGIVNGIVEGFGLAANDSTNTTTTKTPVVNQSSTGFNKNDIVTLSTDATVYQGASKGVAIPKSVKGKKYTVQNISSDGKCLLLKEIVSWVLASECTKVVASTTAQAKPTTTTKNKKLYLPKTATHWNVYPLNKAPVIGNQCGALNPSLFGGLTYDILGYPHSNVVTIQTRDFGKVNIYVGAETGAVIK